MPRWTRLITGIRRDWVLRCPVVGDRYFNAKARQRDTGSAVNEVVHVLGQLHSPASVALLGSPPNTVESTIEILPYKVIQAVDHSAGIARRIDESNDKFSQWGVKLRCEVELLAGDQFGDRVEHRFTVTPLTRTTQEPV